MHKTSVTYLAFSKTTFRVPISWVLLFLFFLFWETLWGGGDQGIMPSEPSTEKNIKNHRHWTQTVAFRLIHRVMTRQWELTEQKGWRRRRRKLTKTHSPPAPCSGEGGGEEEDRASMQHTPQRWEAPGPPELLQKRGLKAARGRDSQSCLKVGVGGGRVGWEGGVSER